MRTSLGGTRHVFTAKERVNFAGRVSLADAQLPTDITLTPAAGGANVSEVTITVVDGGGDPLSGVHVLDVYLSDAATGVGLTATTASGTVTAKTASGTVLGALTTKKALRVSTTAAGVFVLEITDTAKTGFYVCAVLPISGRVIVSDQLVTADYG
jgi:hypothetical protein